VSGLRARPPPDCKQPRVTFLSGTSRDISIWARHVCHKVTAEVLI
jgi:hypothetical protein